MLYASCDAEEVIVGVMLDKNDVITTKPKNKRCIRCKGYLSYMRV